MSSSIYADIIFVLDSYDFKAEMHSSYLYSPFLTIVPCAMKGDVNPFYHGFGFEIRCI